MFGRTVAEHALREMVDPRLTAIGYSPLVGIPLDATRLDDLERVYRQNAATAEPRPTVAEGMASTVKRTRLLR